MSGTAQRRLDAFIDFEDDDDDNKEDGGVRDRNKVHNQGRETDKQKKNFEKLVRGYKEGIRKAKKVALFPFNYFRKSKSSHSSSSSSGACSASLNPRSAKFDSPNTGVVRSNRASSKYLGCFCACLSKPQALDSEIDGADNTDEPELTYEYMKDLVEKNDFFSRECNTHVTEY